MLRWPLDEKGATIVLVAVMMLSLLGLMAVAVEASRLFASKSQMQTAADAAALSAAVAVIRGDTLAAPDSAVAYALANQADAAAMSEDSAVLFGVWDPASRAFAPQATPSGANAIRVRTGQTRANLIAWVFGAPSLKVQALSIAMFGGTVTSTICNKPMAVGTAAIDTNEDGVITQGELDQALAQAEIVLKPAQSPEPATSFYYAVVLPPFYDASEGTYLALDDSVMTGDALRTNIATCNPDLVGAGDSLLTKPGNTFGPVLQGLTALCGEIVAETCNPSGAFSPDGLPGIPVIAPLWDSRFPPRGNNPVEIMALAAFRITRVVVIDLDPSMSEDLRVEVRGRFIRMTNSGTVAPGVGLLQRPFIVR